MRIKPVSVAGALKEEGLRRMSDGVDQKGTSAAGEISLSSFAYPPIVR